MSVALPPLVILPLALVAMLIVSAHVTITQASDAPPSRRRIRIANGWVMLIAIPLIAAGISFVSAETQPRLFTLTWLAVMLLLTMCVFLALADVLNTVRLAREERRRHIIEFVKARQAEEQGDE